MIDNQKPLEIGSKVRLEVRHCTYITCTAMESVYNREWQEYDYILQPNSGGEPIQTWARNIEYY